MFFFFFWFVVFIVAVAASTWMPTLSTWYERYDTLAILDVMYCMYVPRLLFLFLFSFGLFWFFVFCNAQLLLCYAAIRFKFISYRRHEKPIKILYKQKKAEKKRNLLSAKDTNEICGVHTVWTRLSNEWYVCISTQTFKFLHLWFSALWQIKCDFFFSIWNLNYTITQPKYEIAFRALKRWPRNAHTHISLQMQTVMIVFVTFTILFLSYDDGENTLNRLNKMYT